MSGKILVRAARECVIIVTAFVSESLIGVSSNALVSLIMMCSNYKNFELSFQAGF